MTLQEAKNQTAIRNQYGSWDDACVFLLSMTRNASRLIEMLNEAAELYARSKWDEACESYKRKLMNYLPYRDIILDTPESRGETSINGLEAPQASPDKTEN